MKTQTCTFAAVAIVLSACWITACRAADPTAEIPTAQLPAEPVLEGYRLARADSAGACWVESLLAGSRRDEGDKPDGQPEFSSFLILAGRRAWVSNGSPPFLFYEFDTQVATSIPVVAGVYAIDPRRPEKERVAGIPIASKAIQAWSRNPFATYDLQSAAHPVFGTDETLKLWYAGGKSSRQGYVLAGNASAPDHSYERSVYITMTVEDIEAESFDYPNSGQSLFVSASASGRDPVNASTAYVFIEYFGRGAPIFFIAEMSFPANNGVPRTAHLWQLLCPPKHSDRLLKEIKLNAGPETGDSIAVDADCQMAWVAEFFRFTTTRETLTVQPRRPHARWDHNPFVVPLKESEWVQPKLVQDVAPAE